MKRPRASTVMAGSGKKAELKRETDSGLGSRCRAWRKVGLKPRQPYFWPEVLERCCWTQGQV